MNVNPKSTLKEDVAVDREYVKNLLASQKSLAASASSTTSLVYDVFKHKNNKDPEKIKIKKQQSLQSILHSNADEELLQKKPIRPPKSPSEEELSSKVYNSTEKLLNNNIARRLSTFKNESAELPFKEHRHDGIPLSAGHTKGSSNLNDTALTMTPLLATRRRRSSIGQTVGVVRCRTRSGRKSERTTSSGVTRPVYVANTISHTSPLAARAGGVKTKSPKNRKIRCDDCRKRLNITNVFICRCEKKFCAKHRHAELHKCTFDYKADGKKILEKANPLIPIPKLPKI